MIEYIGNRLVQWALWCEQRASGGLGYPRQAAFTRLARSGGERFDVAFVVSEEAWEIERAVCALSAELRAVAMAVYRVQGTTDQACELLGVSRATLYRRIGALHLAVMERLMDYCVEAGDGRGEQALRRKVRAGEDAGRGSAPGAQPLVLG